MLSPDSAQAVMALGSLPPILTVVIGRNEGQRLERCLQSVLPYSSLVVYVDSGSTDGSTQVASTAGAEVVHLDLSAPFTAARARNAGWRRGVALRPDIELVQFVDGDCEVVSGWWEAAVRHLGVHPEVTIVCGRRRERHPEASVYNRLCDWEWDTPIGQALACGGDAMMRIQALHQVGGYRDDMIAGEEPELCVRVRASGGIVWRLDAEMTLHDAALTHFAQWWKRSQRAGFAFALGADLHGHRAERHWVEEARRAWLWGLWLPMVLTGASATLVSAGHPRQAALPWLVYAAQWLRLALFRPGTLRDRFTRSTFLILCKFAEMKGAYKFWNGNRKAVVPQLIEYK